MTICHRPVGGPPITLELPISAAEAHLAEHPNDTEGACPVPEVVEVSEPEVVEPIVEEVPAEEPIATEV